MNRLSLIRFDNIDNFHDNAHDLIPSFARHSIAETRIRNSLPFVPPPWLTSRVLHGVRTLSPTRKRGSGGRIPGLRGCAPGLSNGHAGDVAPAPSLARRAKNMKRHGNLGEHVIGFEALLRAAEKARKGKRFRPAVASFRFDQERALWQRHEHVLPSLVLPITHEGPLVEMKVTPVSQDSSLSLSTRSRQIRTEAVPGPSPRPRQPLLASHSSLLAAADQLFS
jgi:hypothetical protein